LDKGGEAFGSSEEVAAEEELADFVPIDFADVEAESDPSARADLGGQVIALGLSDGQSGVFSWEGFAGDGNYAITVVVIQKVGECSLADEKGRVRSVDYALRFRKSESELSKACEARIFFCLLGQEKSRRF
jgi:hypothetical protein